MAERTDDRSPEAYRMLRNHLNPVIRGAVTDAILEAIAENGMNYLLENVEAVNAQIFIATAEGTFLDDKLASYEIIRPGEVGLSDDVFREIGINVKSKKQIRMLVHRLLESIYGFEYSRAISDSSEFEPYNLQDGDRLILQMDGGEEVEVEFLDEQFSSISAATAVEVADVITRSLARQGASGGAVAKDNGSGYFVKLLSETKGPSSSVKVLGGRAQNELRFDSVRPTTGVASTQWTISRVAGSGMRATWTGGANPGVGKVQKGDYVNMFATSLDPNNQGTFNVTAVKGGTVGSAYFDFDNPEGVEETVSQGTADGVLFFFPKRHTLVTKRNFTGAFQVSENLIQVYMPAVTRVVRRDRVGAGHVQEYGDSDPDVLGPYVFDPEQAFSISGTYTALAQAVDSDSNYIISVDDSSEFPDGEHKVIFGYGTKRQEGPVKVISRPSDGTLFIDPGYRFQKSHPVGEDVSMLHEDTPFVPAADGTDHQFYITDVVSGREYAQELIELVVATGMNLVFIILYPGDEGLGKWGTDNSEKVEVWG